METYHIHINGIVQGVGFRPMVYTLANEMQINGYIKNGNDGVHIFCNATEQEANIFFKKIKEQAPSQSKIISSYLIKSTDESFTGFSIVVENDTSEKQVLISPDKSVCTACKIELQDVNNRRYRYAFVTCTQCGPRYSIINDVPYERHSTAMQPFTMCQICTDEYNNVTNRRFFSQTNSCADCGVTLSLYDKTSSILSNDSEEIL